MNKILLTIGTVFLMSCSLQPKSSDKDHSSEPVLCQNKNTLDKCKGEFKRLHSAGGLSAFKAFFEKSCSYGLLDCKQTVVPQRLGTAKLFELNRGKDSVYRFNAENGDAVLFFVRPTDIKLRESPNWTGQ